MLGGFLTVIGTILSLVFWMMQRSAKKSDDPKVQYERARSENAKLIIKADETGVNARLDGLLNGLSNVQSHPR